MNTSNLPLTEELDFVYLLELMRPLHNEPRFAWLPELFSIIGPECLIKLCKYAGGECIKLPTSEELLHSIHSLQAFYNVYIKKSSTLSDVSENLQPTVARIKEIYDAEHC